MKHTPTKAELRARLHRDIQAFVAAGGEIRQVPRGVSGQDPLHRGQQPLIIRERARRDDKPLLQVMAAIDARRKKPTQARAKTPKRPRRRPVYDDFGELIRWVWE